MGGLDKLLAPLGGIPVIARAIRAFQAEERIREIIISAPPDGVPRFRQIIEEYGLSKVSCVVPGGPCRGASVLNALRKAGTPFAAVHDGARPMLTGDLLDRLLSKAGQGHGCVPVIPARDTVKVVGRDGIILETPPRDSLFLAQTPQVFPVAPLLAALEEAGRDGLSFTDESSLMESRGFKVLAVPGDERNLKITTPLDMEIAALFLS
jgi:2-C-methyl-D-erythritol 4-phosphate cytidylyltransferase